MTAKTTCHDGKPLLGLLDKAVKNKPLTRRQLQRNSLIAKIVCQQAGVRIIMGAIRPSSSMTIGLE